MTPSILDAEYAALAAMQLPEDHTPLYRTFTPRGVPIEVAIRRCAKGRQRAGKPRLTGGVYIRAVCQRKFAHEAYLNSTAHVQRSVRPGWTTKTLQRAIAYAVKQVLLMVTHLSAVEELYLAVERLPEAAKAQLEDDVESAQLPTIYADMMPDDVERIWSYVRKYQVLTRKDQTA